MNNVTAEWSMSLYCDCPKCFMRVDLLDYPDFWEDRRLDPCEHNTDRSRGVEVRCPECAHEFEVDLVY